jgi:hypothetical protein
VSANIESGMFEDSRRQVQALAVNAFKDHVLTEEGDGRWLCKRPGTGTYWFRLVTAPSSIIILGDLGECILRPYCKQDQAVSWLRGAVNSPGYFIEKVQASKAPPKAFYPSECMQWMAGYIGERDDDDDTARTSELREALQEMREQYRDEALTHESWLRIARDYDIDDVYGVAMHLSSNMLWMIEVCRCFVRLHDAAVEAVPIKAAEVEAVQ